MSSSSASFYNLYTQGFLRVATATPNVCVAAPLENLANIEKAILEANSSHAGLVLFPELSLSAYAIDDLLFQDALLDEVESMLEKLVDFSEGKTPVILVGAPLRNAGRLYNCACIIHRGRLLGIVPKGYLPNYREFYEGRQATSGFNCPVKTIQIGSREIPFGMDLLFVADDMADFVLHAEICEDVWVPHPPSTGAALAGATVLANLSASNVTIGKSDYRHALCRVHSTRTMSAYLYSAAGFGESTTDLAWDGHAMIYENGVLLAESKRFQMDGQLILADVDLDLLRQERMRHGTFHDCYDKNSDSIGDFRRITFNLNPERDENLGLNRNVDRFPYVPNNDSKLNELCFEAYNIQVHGLKKRLRAANINKLVIGISGGLDSTQALLVAVQAFDELGFDRNDILAYTLPAFATSVITKSSAWSLMLALGVRAGEIDLVPAASQMLQDIGHDAADGKPVYDVTYENVQAGARTSLLFRLANKHDALVLGTGDLSELALGWCTYGVGDHMSHYNVNSSVSKTLIQHLIRWVAATDRFGGDTRRILYDILNTEISPELIPGDDGNEIPAQITEEIVGPYALQDFNLFYLSRHSFRPSKVAFLAWHAWRDATHGDWPPHMKDEKKVGHDLKTIRKWLRIFLWRFFQTSQFKRSAMPNGPKVSSGGSLSPRGDWRAPSDSNSAVWIRELDKHVPEN